jgi:hypothetical protein
MMAVAIFLEITGEDAATASYTWRLRLHRQDGTVVSIAGTELSTSGVFQAARAPDDVVIVANQAIQFNGISLEPGAYYWELLVDGEHRTRRPFVVSNLSA